MPQKMILMYRDEKGNPQKGALIYGQPANWEGKIDKIQLAQTIMGDRGLDPFSWSDLQKAIYIISGSMLWLAYERIDQKQKSERFKHLPGKHDQRTHGRRGGVASSSSNSDDNSFHGYKIYDDPNYSGRRVVLTRDLFDYPNGPFIVTNPSRKSDISKYTERTVDISEIIPSQTDININGLKAYMDNPPKELPEVARVHTNIERYKDMNGRLMVISGHTRLGALKLNGKKKADVKYIDVTLSEQYKNGPFTVIWKTPKEKEFYGVSQYKHLPGKHDQLMHGRWAHGGQVSASRTGSAAAAPSAPAAAPAVPASSPSSSISAHLTIRATDKTLKSEMKSVIGSINSIHGDGPLSAIPLLESPNEIGGTMGDFYSVNKSPVHILVKTNIQNEAQLTVAHEIGHYIDHQGLSQYNDAPFALSQGVLGGKGRSTYPKPVSAAMKQLETAFKNSEAYKSFDNIAKTGVVTGVNNTKVKADLNFSGYLFDKKEMFARAYSQYIAMKSNNTQFMHELSVQISTQKSYGGYQRYWDQADFQPIQQGFDALFGALGWSK